jgi:photosystem II stability/assembly factor-like uncharacterized protein
MASVLVLVGTKRGAFILRSDETRQRWETLGPLANSGWSFGYLCYDPGGDCLFAAGLSVWYGPAVWKSRDCGETWSHSSEGLTLGDNRPSVKQIWNITSAHGAVFAGVDPAGLFRSDDHGDTWTQVGAPLLDQPSASAWRAGKGGICLHSIVRHPTDPNRTWVAIAGGGVMFTSDGGQTWEPRNAAIADESGQPQPGYRVQRLAIAPGRPELLYQQNHRGVFRTFDGGITWEDVSAGLPDRFGFPLAIHPRDPATLYVIPHRNDVNGRFVPDGRVAVWRSQDGGDSWEGLTRGLPEQRAFVEILRHGMATDACDPAGVYFGTTSGQVYGSNDEGETWATLAAHLPEIYSVAAVVVD